MIAQTRPWVRLPDWRARVWLNGVELSRCFYADDVEGVARVESESGEEIEMRGNVSIEWPTAQA